TVVRRRYAIAFGSWNLISVPPVASVDSTNPSAVYWPSSAIFGLHPARTAGIPELAELRCFRCLRWMEQSVGFQRVNRFGEAKAATQAEPFSGVTMPLDVEATAADPVEASERGVELFAEILGKAGAVALNEPVFGAVPLSQDIDRVVELRRPDSGQE